MKTNLTLQLDADLIREAKVLAAKQGTSVSRLLADQLEALVRRDKGYERAKRRALTRMDHGFDIGWTPSVLRGELHERSANPAYGAGHGITRIGGYQPKASQSSPQKPPSNPPKIGKSSGKK